MWICLVMREWMRSEELVMGSVSMGRGFHAPFVLLCHELVVSWWQGGLSHVQTLFDVHIKCTYTFRTLTLYIHSWFVLCEQTSVTCSRLVQFRLYTSLIQENSMLMRKNASRPQHWDSIDDPLVPPQRNQSLRSPHWLDPIGKKTLRMFARRTIVKSLQMGSQNAIILFSVCWLP